MRISVHNVNGISPADETFGHIERLVERKKLPNRPDMQDDYLLYPPGRPNTPIIIPKSRVLLMTIQPDEVTS